MAEVSQSNPRPNVFLIGAPRSGATAMVEYLRGHPYVFFPANPKPHYWATDFPGLRHQSGVTEQRDYFAAYAACNQRHQVIGDGSTMYLTSEEAVEQITAFNPNAQFVVMLRQPVDLVTSFYRHLLRLGDEEQTDFEMAWALQDQRRRRKSIPPSCRESRLLQYREVGMIGQQLERVMKFVPDERLQIHFFEDLRSKPRQTYQKTMSFLDLPDDDRREFPLIASKKAHSPIVRHVMKAPLARRFYAGVKSKLSGRIATAVRDSVLIRPAEEALVRPIFRNKLVDEYADDIRLLASLTHRNLDEWLHQSAV